MTICVEINIRQLSNDRRNEFISFCSRFPKFFRIDVKVLEQRKNPRKAVQPFENKKRKIDIFKNYEANGVEKIQRKLEIFSTLISKKSKTSIFSELNNLVDISLNP